MAGEGKERRHSSETHALQSGTVIPGLNLSEHSDSDVDTPLGPNGEQYPTGGEKKTLRRVFGHIPWTAYTIAFVELCERFSYYGRTVVCMYFNPWILSSYSN